MPDFEVYVRRSFERDDGFMACAAPIVVSGERAMDTLNPPTSRHAVRDVEGRGENARNGRITTTAGATLRAGSVPADQRKGV